MKQCLLILSMMNSNIINLDSLFIGNGKFGYSKELVLFSAFQKLNTL